MAKPLRRTNDPEHRAFKRYLATHTISCWECGARATVPDHDPPESQHTHRRGTGCCTLRPHCRTCSARQGAQIVNGTYLANTKPLADWFS